MAAKGFSLIDELERVEEALTKQIVDEAHKIDDALGDRPFHGKRRSPTERLQYYDTIKNDPEEWDRLIQKNGPGEALRFAVDMERLRNTQMQEPQ